MRHVVCDVFVCGVSICPPFIHDSMNVRHVQNRNIFHHIIAVVKYLRIPTIQSIPHTENTPASRPNKKPLKSALDIFENVSTADLSRLTWCLAHTQNSTFRKGVRVQIYMSLCGKGSAYAESLAVYARIRFCG